MVDDLTQALAQRLGLEIHIISPYYNFNRKVHIHFTRLAIS